MHHSFIKNRTSALTRRLVSENIAKMSSFSCQSFYFIYVPFGHTITRLPLDSFLRNARYFCIAYFRWLQRLAERFKQSVTPALSLLVYFRYSLMKNGAMIRAPSPVFDRRQFSRQWEYFQLSYEYHAVINRCILCLLSFLPLAIPTWRP
jgi:hypothetical protein